jgi:hypothetical protein
MRWSSRSRCGDQGNTLWYCQCVIHKEKSNKMQQCIKILLFHIYMKLNMFRATHTAHHNEPKTAMAASGFSYVEGCWTCSWWTVSGTVCAWQRPPTTRPTTFHVWKTRGCQCSFRLLMMGLVSPETCSALYKYEIKIWCSVASCWIFLYELYCDARIHEHQVIQFLPDSVLTSQCIPLIRSV